MSEQCAKILSRLEQGPATSWQLGPELRILSITRRIFELRKLGFDIRMSETWDHGKRVCCYRLVVPVLECVQ